MPSQSTEIRLPSPEKRYHVEALDSLKNVYGGDY